MSMSLSVIFVSEYINHGDSEKSFGYIEDVHDSEQMLEILNRLFDEFMMNICFPAHRSAGPCHCNVSI